MRGEEPPRGFARFAIATERAEGHDARRLSLLREHALVVLSTARVEHRHRPFWLAARERRANIAKELRVSREPRAGARRRRRNAFHGLHR